MDLELDDSAPWTGRTTLVGDLGQERFKLREQQTLTALTVREWLGGDSELPDNASFVAEAQAEYAVSEPGFYDAGFTGWQWSPPPAPYRIAPIPLGLEIVREDHGCPLDALAPWWDLVAPSALESVAPIAALNGEKLSLGTRGGVAWASGSFRAVSEHAHISVFEGFLEVLAKAKLTDERISGPGRIGSLIPGYAEVKGLAPDLSQTSRYLDYGFRIDFDFISAITLSMKHHTFAPLLVSKLKALKKRRGYAGMSRAMVGIEFSDGWRPLRAELELGPSGSDPEPLEERLEAFVQWLVRVVAASRADQANSSILQALTTADVVFDVETRDKERWSTFRCEIPGSRPISAVV